MGKTLVVAVLVLLASCSGGHRLPDDTNDLPLPGGLGTAYIPFVEDVRLPLEVSAGESFDVVLTVSAHSKAAILSQPLGLRQLQTYAIGALGFHKPGYVLDPYIAFQDNTGANSGTPPERVELSIRCFGLPAGEYSLYVHSADSKENGGMGRSFNFSSYQLIDESNVATTEIPFTVGPNSQ